MNEKFTNEARYAVNLAFMEAAELGSTYVGTEHLLIALSRTRGETGRLLCSLGMGAEELRKRIYDRYAPSSEEGCRDMTPKLKKLLLRAAKEASAERAAGCRHLLAALLAEECAAARLADGFCGSARLREGIIKLTAEVQAMHKNKERTKKPTPLLDKNGCDLTEKAICGRVDPVIGREKEEERVLQILLRRTKNNPCLIGEPGVGKTAVAEAVALRIAEGRVPAALAGKRLVALDVPSLVAGTKYRGEFEDKLRGIIEEVRSAGDVILFADEIHTVVGAGAAEGAIDAANILKPYLARGELQLIGATTLKEYKKYIEKDGALERRFQCVTLEEPDREGCLYILKGLRRRYEDFHGVTISDEALKTAVDLSLRYIGERALPDKAIDLMDEAAARMRMKDCGGRSAPKVDRTAVEAVLEDSTGIRVCKALTAEGLYEGLKEAVRGQDGALKELARALVSYGKDGREGAGACLLFTGGRSVGKKTTAKAAAKLLFGTDKAFFAFDMGEFCGMQGFGRLFGGGGEGGLLTEKVRRKGRCLLFLDNMQKASPEVMGALRQITEEGTYTDGNGLNISFGGCITVMSAVTEERAAAGFAAETARADPFIEELAALADETIAFCPCKGGALKEVAEGCLEELKQQYLPLGISLAGDEDFLPAAVAFWEARGVSHGELTRRLRLKTRRLIAEQLPEEKDCRLTLFWEGGEEKIKISAKNY